MTYRMGIGTRMARAFGLEAGPPYVRCDACAFVRSDTRADGLPCAWLMRGKAPPGWLRMGEAESRQDFCPTCRARVEGLS